MLIVGVGGCAGSVRSSRERLTATQFRQRATQICENATHSLDRSFAATGGGPITGKVFGGYLTHLAAALRRIDTGLLALRGPLPLEGAVRHIAADNAQALAIDAREGPQISARWKGQPVPDARVTQVLSALQRIQQPGQLLAANENVSSLCIPTA